MFWNVHRFVVCGIIILLLALLNVSESIRTYHLGYQISKAQKELKIAFEKEKHLTQAICNFKLPRNILAKASALGIQTKSLSSEAIANLHSIETQTMALAKVSKNARRVR